VAVGELPMPLAELYAPLKLAHIGLVTLSGVLFAVRGAAALAGPPERLAPMSENGERRFSSSGIMRHAQH